jgi:hypothetical protein
MIDVLKLLIQFAYSLSRYLLTKELVDCNQSSRYLFESLNARQRGTCQVLLEQVPLVSLLEAHVADLSFRSSSS